MRLCERWRPAAGNSKRGPVVFCARIRLIPLAEEAMADYKNPSVVARSMHPRFDELTSPGEAVPYSGIYRCDGCAHEIVSTEGHVMPPQNHHQHSSEQGAIRWRLIVSPR